MITFDRIGYMGRLGNQMFQFASSLGIAKRLGFQAVFPKENCITVEYSGPIDPKTGTNMGVKCDLLDCFDINQNFFVRKIDIPISYSYREHKFTYNEETEKLPFGCNLDGYFQNEKYFSDIRDLILKEFSFKDEFIKFSESFMKGIKDNLSNYSIVSVHVRRGDYLLYPDHHPACQKDYYEKAIKLMETLVNSPHFLIFSDDPEWCRQEFDSEKYTIVESGNPYEELCLMTLCDHNIIANSSFSWWGSWLGKNEDKKVIAPQKWFGHLLPKDTSEIYSKNWIKI